MMQTDLIGETVSFPSPDDSSMMTGVLRCLVSPNEVRGPLITEGHLWSVVVEVEGKLKHVALMIGELEVVKTGTATEEDERTVPGTIDVTELPQNPIRGQVYRWRGHETSPITSHWCKGLALMSGVDWWYATTHVIYRNEFFCLNDEHDEPRE